MNTKTHWENIYSSKDDNEVSWFQENPETSLSLIEKYSNYAKDKSIIDVGGGNSLLVSSLHAKGFSNLSVLDISSKALERSRGRLTDVKINWITANILDYNFSNQVDIWHDRAVFHFLTSIENIQKYVEIASKTIQRNGYLILGTFAETGPEKCSGLTIAQYSKTKLELLFSEKFNLIECFEETHITPFNTSQDFIWVVYKRK